MATSDNKKVGRPKVQMPKDTRVGIRLDNITLQLLENYCLKNNISKSDCIRNLIKENIK